MLIKRYAYFKWEYFKNMLDLDQFVVFNTPTSIKVGVGGAAKFEPVEFASSNYGSFNLI